MGCSAANATKCPVVHAITHVSYGKSYGTCHRKARADFYGISHRKFHRISDGMSHGTYDGTSLQTWDTMGRHSTRRQPMAHAMACCHIPWDAMARPVACYQQRPCREAWHASTHYTTSSDSQSHHRAATGTVGPSGLSGALSGGTVILKGSKEQDPKSLRIVEKHRGTRTTDRQG